MRTARSALAVVAVAAALFGSGCVDPSHEASKILDKSGIELDNLGKTVPASFPTTEVALPELTLETGVGTGGIYVFRYTSPNPAADIAAYQARLVAIGFTIVDAFDDLLSADGSTNPSGHVGFIASGPRWTVDAVAFGAGPADGNYMAIDVEPRHG